MEKNGRLMVASMLAHSKKERDTVKVNPNGLTAITIKAIGRGIQCLATVSSNGAMAAPIMDNGKLVLCTAWEFKSGLMVDNTKENLKMVKQKVTGCTITQMEGSTKVIGTMENNTVKA